MPYSCKQELKVLLQFSTIVFQMSPLRFPYHRPWRSFTAFKNYYRRQRCACGKL